MYNKIKMIERKSKNKKEMDQGVMGKKKKSLKLRLIEAFCLTSIVPVILVNLFTYHNTANIVRENVQELSYFNLLQTKSSLDVWLESYEDILFQIYTDDDIVAMIDKINLGEDVSVTKNQLRRTLHGLFYTKEYIQCISILTQNGTLVFYDLLTGSSTQTSWLDDMEMSREELYNEISADNVTHIISTQKTRDFGTEDHYLFHIGHRIIDYRNVQKELGIVVVSINEELLSSVCSSEKNLEGSYNFMVDHTGRMVSFPEKSLLSDPVIEWSENEEERKNAYAGFIKTQSSFGGEHRIVNLVYDEKFGCDVINVSSQEEMIRRLDAQQQIMLVVLGISVGTLIVAIFILTQRLSGSLQKVAFAMEEAGQGRLSARVITDKTMPGEVETIAVEFNHMLERLSESMEKEREAGERQRQAEITALEAQMNPHFLYNTLDTINWMAIDKEEYEISNSIGALAHILRYGIDNSNGIVTVREECDWLKKYLFLQQTRLKNTFQCEVHIEPELMECRMHKLLLQPFVENAILHGFEGIERIHILKIEISAREAALHIEIYDNGRGIPEKTVEQMNLGNFPGSSEKNHIGMENAMNRIHIYYGAKGNVQIESCYGEWTKIIIEVPKDEDSDRGR